METEIEVITDTASANAVGAKLNQAKAELNGALQQAQQNEEDIEEKLDRAKARQDAAKRSVDKWTQRLTQATNERQGIQAKINDVEKALVRCERHYNTLDVAAQRMEIQRQIELLQIQKDRLSMALPD
ncbi:hypothetical protein V7S43_002886 [Phytophthora oleae]|uniref:Uncharacterized protein n=1 Tax=Phytophthora oleae TaxID=2107226 RepID=A0ABD3G190_9STRA